MENLNDVEFGSNQSTEEAPILVAQRYLNIFRQIHIFNKDMRTKFDDELLALPPNITDFFKRLPGGRLLVEHMEDVKTERGISFEKSNREDFSDGLNDNAAPATYAAPVPAQITGGSLVVDESFAETLAKSMANAFKEIPSAPVSSGGPVVSGDFGQSFELIAEEIRTSRASLLDVLKETRNITDSVIASQVSISRILEGILSSRQHEENDATNLNNRIIASQASITKLLEGLYTASTQKNAEISDYLNVDNKLQDFRDSVSQKINETLGILTQKNNIADISENMENKLSAFRNEIKTDVNNSLSEIRQMLFNYIQSNPANVPQKAAAPVATSNDKVAAQPVNGYAEDTFLNDESRKKKKKKKKKNGESFAASDFAGNTAFAGGIAGQNQTAFADEDDDFDTDGETDTSDDLTSFAPEESAAPIDGVIRNSEYKHEDDFSNVDLSMPPLDGTPDIASGTDSLDSLDFDVPGEQEAPLDKGSISSIVQNQPQKTDIDEEDFDLSYLTRNPEQEESSLDNLGNLDNFTDDFDLPAQDTGNDSINLDDTIADLSTSAEDAVNRFDSSLDEITEQPEEATLSDVSEPTNALDEFDEITEQPEEDTLPNVSEPADTSDEFAEEEDEEFEEKPAKPDETSDLDSFGSLHVGSLDDFANTEPQNNAAVVDIEEDTAVPETEEYEEESEEENDDFPQIQQPESKEQSRYSAELDKIRQALTSDNIDISSLDEPIALDDYSDDENVTEDEEPAPQTSANDDQDWEYEYVEDDGTGDATDTTDNSTQETQEKSDNNEDWEWEYVDENGQAATVPGNKEGEGTEEGDGDWEWEYVEDDGNGSGEDNENNIQ